MEIMLLGSLRGLLYFADVKDLGEIPVWSPPPVSAPNARAVGKNATFDK